MLITVKTVLLIQLFDQLLDMLLDQQLVQQLDQQLDQPLYQLLDHVLDHLVSDSPDGKLSLLKNIRYIETQDLQKKRINCKIGDPFLSL